MTDKDLRTLKENDNHIVSIKTYDGEVMMAKVRFVSQSEQDLVYDLISTSKESQYEKHDEQPAYLIKFVDIESVDVPAEPGPTAVGPGGGSR
jgi:GH15 family glucan-1,4-alpha-glucosidase